MRNILYISPDFPYNFQNFIKRLHQSGVSVYAIGENDFYSLPEDLRHCLRWYERVNLNDVDEVKRVAHHINEKAKADGFKGLDAVESHNEHWLRVEACINTELNLKGPHNSSVELWKKKSLMKKAMQEIGLPVAPGECIETLQDALLFTKKHGHPVILKPDEGVGAFSTHKVSGDSELRSLFPTIQCKTFIEKFIHGRMVTFDGLTDSSGKIVFENSLIYGNGVLENVQGLDTFFYTRREIPKDLSEMGTKIVKAFGIKSKFFHIEFFETSKGLVPLEVNARAPGGPIVDMFNYSASRDLYQGYADVICENTVLFEKEKPYFCSYAGRKDKYYRYSHEDIMQRFGHRIVNFGENPALYVEGMGRYRYIFITETEEELYQIRNFIFEGHS